MKALKIVLFLSVFLNGCYIFQKMGDDIKKQWNRNQNCDTSLRPDPPFANPDDYSSYTGGSGIFYYSYTYNCFAGSYIKYTYKYEACRWELDGRYESSGICN